MKLHIVRSQTLFHNSLSRYIYKKIVHQHNLLGFGLEDTLIKRL